MTGCLGLGKRRGYTRTVDTHTQMRSTAHDVRSDTPGNGVSLIVISDIFECRQVPILIGKVSEPFLTISFSHHMNMIILIDKEHVTEIVSRY